MENFHEERVISQLGDLPEILHWDGCAPKDVQK